jgi:hypothetical protein
MTTLGSEEIAMPPVIYGILAYFTCFVALMVGRRFIPAAASGASMATVSASAAVSDT